MKLYGIAWITFRSKSIYEDTLAMNIKDINTMTYQAIWEYNQGKNIKDEDLDSAYKQKKGVKNKLKIFLKTLIF